MKRFFNILSAAILCVALTSPSVVAQGRNGRGATQTSQHRQAPASGNKSEHGSQKGAGNKGNSRPATGAQSHNSHADQKRPGETHSFGTTDLRKSNSGNKQQTKVNKPQLPATDHRPNNSSTGRPGNGGYGNDNNSTRPGNGNNNNATRPGNNSGDRPGSSNAMRPGNNGGDRPGNGNNNNANRPGNNGNNRPGNNGNNRPGNNAFGPDHQHGHPGGSGQPNHGNNHQRPNNPGTPPPPAFGYGPGGDRWHGNFHSIPHHAPHRPMLPPPPPHYVRPIAPPAFRPAPNGPRFSTILGIALGSAIDFTLNQLFNNGYYVTGYTNNAVYLNDVLMLNLVWPNVTLQYNHGRLIGSEFVYPSAYYNTDIYYKAYNKLQASYGVPISMDYLAGGGMQATWFGYDGRYVTLTFQGGTAIDGQLRYYTTLSYGN